ncbi:MAG: endonuclease/exonuclease/phosphatase family protein, partial [Pseudomonadota bacterium]
MHAIIRVVCGIGTLALAIAAHPGTASAMFTIMEIQGAGHSSPLDGQTVTTRGIVTVVTNNGFYMTDADGDQDTRTSDGIFVFTGSAPTVSSGDDVEVEGVVSELLPGNNAQNLTITQLVSPIINVLSSGNPVPLPFTLGRGGRRPPIRVIDNDNFGTFDPHQDGIDFYESLEGMQVTIADAWSVWPTNRFGEIWVVPESVRRPSLNEQGGTTIRKLDFNPERIQIDDSLFSGSNPQVDAGDFLGTITGVVSYSFGNFEVLPTEAPVVTPGSSEKETTTLEGSGSRLTAATFNVQNLDPGDGDRFDDLAQIIVDNLKSPDIIGLQEVQDNSGPTNDGIVDADQTFGLLIDAIVNAGGPAYEFREVPPENNQDGGQPGGNIRVGFLFKPSRVEFLDKGNAGANDATAFDQSSGGLTLSPGRIDPTNEAFDDSRKSLAGEFLFQGKTVFVIVSHFSSKSGSSPLFGSIQPPINGSEDERLAQAQVVNDFVDSVLEFSKDANIVVLGDFNEFEFFRSLLVPQFTRKNA